MQSDQSLDLCSSQGSNVSSGGFSDSVGSVRLGIEELLVRDSPPVKSLCCVLEQDTLSAA